MPATNMEPLERVAHLLVTRGNRPLELDGMDSERCIALHNAIFEHGWIKSGRDAADFYAKSNSWSIHRAAMNVDMTKDFDLHPKQPWQKLESILSVWIEMIQRQKVVALHDNVGSEADDTVVLRIKGGPERDPDTGAKRLAGVMTPWAVQPWTKLDLQQSLRSGV